MNRITIPVNLPDVDVIRGGVGIVVEGENLDTNLVSDGYHTFGELYEHRIQLWIAVCRLWDEFKSQSQWKTAEGRKYYAWRSLKHSNGSSYEGWFLLGIITKEGKQLSYHLPISKWDECEFATTKELAPEFDGHTSDDVLNRLKDL